MSCLARHFVAVIGVVAVVGSSDAVAGPLLISDIQGSWTSTLSDLGGPVAVQNAAGNGADALRWGGNQLQSGYDFIPGPDHTVTPGTPFLLGQLTHINMPIPGTAASLLQATYTLSFLTNGTPSPLSTNIDLGHDETVNTVVNGCCDDILTITSLVFNAGIVVSGESYVFNLLGFSADSGVTFGQEFASPELGSNTVNLYGLVTSEQVQAMPEPATLVLLGLGLAGVAAVRRRSPRGR